jgi:hypothetical protein
MKLIRCLEHCKSFSSSFFLLKSYISDMVRPKKLKRFERVCMSKNYWLVYDDGQLIGHVTVGSNRNYYYCNIKGNVLQENLPNMATAYQSFTSLREISLGFKIVLS